MKKNKITLSNAEFVAVCEATDNIIVDLNAPNWSYTMLQDYQEAVSNEEGIDSRKLFRYLFFSTDIELLEFLISMDEYWGLDEVIYKKLNYIPPKEKIIEIKSRTKPNKKPFEMDENQISIMEFLMTSQSFGNDFIIYVDKSQSIDSDNSNDENYLVDSFIRWSVNKNNIGKMLEKLSSCKHPIRIHALKDVKIRITD